MTRGQALRRRVYENFDRWDIAFSQVSYSFLRGSGYNSYAQHLCWLLGRETTFREDPVTSMDMTEREWSLCEALAGEHGYSIYKTLLIRRGLDRS
jgi:hypothetical protein